MSATNRSGIIVRSSHGGLLDLYAIKVLNDPSSFVVLDLHKLRDVFSKPRLLLNVLQC